MAQRSDAPLIRHLAQTYGPETAKEWQRPPLVVLPDEGFVEHLGTFFETVGTTCQAVEHLPWRDSIYDFPRGAILPLPSWEDQGPVQNRARLRRQIDELLDGGDISADYHQEMLAVLDMTGGVEVEDVDARVAGMKIGVWLRVRSGAAWLAGMGAMPWMNREYAETLRTRLGETPDHMIMLDIWEREERLLRDGFSSTPFMPHPVTIGMERADPQQHFIVPCLRPDCLCREPHGIIALRQKNAGALYHQAAYALLAYLTQCNEHMVEVTPTPAKPPPANQQKVQNQKPWLKETLPHYILLDPAKVGEYGHPSGRGAPIGHHAPPRPHTRRGHWATLRHEKFARDEDGAARRVWRKQAWVGATEWTDLDQRYRVVLLAPEPALPPTIRQLVHR